MTAILTLHNPDDTFRYYQDGHWRPESFYMLLRQNAQDRPDARVLRDARRHLSYAEALDWVDAIAARFEAAGLKPGDRVALSMTNRVEAPLAFLACSRNGYICNPSLHQNFTTAEAMTLLDRIGASALIAQPGYGEGSQVTERTEAARDLETMKAVFKVGADNEPGDLAPPHDGDAAPRTPVAGADKIVYLAFTSGTTGLPKAVMHSDNTLLANARPMVRDWGHDHETVLVSLSPLSHHNGWVALGQMLVAGGQLVVNDPPAGMKPYDWIMEAGASYIMGVPTHAIDLLADMRARGATSLGRVKTWYVAGAPIPRDVARTILDLGITPQNVYGMTENSSHQYPLPTDSETILTETCGRANPGYEVRIFDPADQTTELKPGEVGEIGGRGACLMLGYFDNQKATESSFSETGWFMTGDLGTLDEDGCLSIVGRAKDIVIRGGHNIFPTDIENRAIEHPAVATAAAFGVPDERLGEKVCLALTLNAGCDIGDDEILQHLASVGLSKYDMPEFLAIMTEMPRTASGKILKRTLADDVRDGRLTPRAVRYRAKG